MHVILRNFQRDASFMCFPCSHEVSFYIGFPSHAILYMLPLDFISDTPSKKRNFYTRVVSAVMCVVTFLPVMLCCIVLYCVVPCSRSWLSLCSFRHEIVNRFNFVLYDGRKLFLMAETPQWPKMLLFDGWNALRANNAVFFMAETPQGPNMQFFHWWNAPDGKHVIFNC